MWDTNYLRVADSSKFEDLVRSNLSAFARPSAYSNVQSSSLESDQDVAAEVATALGAVEPLTSHLTFDAAKDTAQVEGGKGHGAGAVVTVKEDLRPAASALTFTELFLAGVVAPAMQQALHRHRERAAALLAATAPPPQPNALYGDLEMRRQHAALRARIGVLTGDFEAFVRLCRGLVSGMPALHDEAGKGSAAVFDGARSMNGASLYASMSRPALSLFSADELFDSDDEAGEAEGGGTAATLSAATAANAPAHGPGASTEGKHLFKTTKSKASLVLCHVPTNLMIHATELTLSRAAASGGSVAGSQCGGGRVGGVEAAAAPPKSRSLFGTTFGAPAAHALGWKHGGLRATLEALDRSVVRNTKPGSGHQVPHLNPFSAHKALCAR
jgi:hypothetical protein